MLKQFYMNGNHQLHVLDEQAEKASVQLSYSVCTNSKVIIIRIICRLSE